jgi:hypothetical protein
MQSAHDYYADPTVFDRCHMRLAGWTGLVMKRVRPYGWSLAFHGLAALCYLVLAVLAADAEAAGFAGTRTSAAIVGVSLALVAGIQFQRIARRVWPQPPAAVTPAVPGSMPVRPERRSNPARRAQAQVFFAAVRDAGANITAARALFRAGIQSLDELRETDDRRLLAIQGIGPATLARLRSRFGRRVAAGDHAEPARLA